MSRIQKYREDEEKKKKKAEEQSKLLRRVGNFTAIPVIFFVYGFLGWLVGQWLDKKFHANGLILAACILFFMAGAFREIFSMIKKL